MGHAGQRATTRRGSGQIWLGAFALIACFSVVLNVLAVDSRSDATEDVQLVGPAAITIATAVGVTITEPSGSSGGEPQELDEPDPDVGRAPPLPAPPVEPPAPALGRTVMLNIARRLDSGAPASVFAYTPCDADVGTTDALAALGGERLWRQPADGMSPVTPLAGATLGYAYPHDGQLVRPLPLSAYGTTVVSNLAAGGATWEWTDRTGTQFVNHYDLGRELQASFFIRTSDGRTLNPTEAGDRFGDGRIPLPLRHTSPLVDATVVGARMVTSSVPLEWSPPRVDARAGNAHPVIYPDVRLGKDVELGYQGHLDVARYDTIVTLPAQAHDGDLEAPTVYLRNSFNRVFAFDARTQALTPLQPTRSDKKGVDWTPPSGWGAVIATDATGAHAFAIYAVTTAAGGTITEFTAHDFHVAGGADGAADVGTMKLRALRVGDFPAGTTRTTAYIVTGSLESVQREMAALAAEGVM